MLTFKDLIDNIKYARRGLAIEVRDPWKRKEIEDELNKRGLSYAKGAANTRQAYAYAITSGSKEELRDFVKWFTKEDYKYYIDKHSLFKTKITCLVRE